MSRRLDIPMRALSVALGLLMAAGVAQAQASAPAAAEGFATGEVRRIDREARKITLRHGEIANLTMPPMTMVFQVADPGLLDRAKVGDRVHFRADKVEGGYRVMEIRPAP